MSTLACVYYANKLSLFHQTVKNVGKDKKNLQISLTCAYSKPNDAMSSRKSCCFSCYYTFATSKKMRSQGQVTLYPLLLAPNFCRICTRTRLFWRTVNPPSSLPFSLNSDFFWLVAHQNLIRVGAFTCSKVNRRV